MSHVICFSEGKLLKGCVMRTLGKLYDTCTVSSDLNDYGSTMIIDYQKSFFPHHYLNLEQCKYTSYMRKGKVQVFPIKLRVCPVKAQSSLYTCML